MTIAPPKPPVTHEQPAAKRDGPLRLGGQVLDAKILKRVMPVYPQLAKNARVSGKVRKLGTL